MSGHEPYAPLAGVRVIDLSTTLPGAMATQFLADAGADVVLVERPGGNAVRAEPGWPGLLRGKRSIVLDLAQAEGRATLDDLLAGADASVTTLRPETERRLGLVPTELVARHPHLVAGAITGFGRSGPWAEYPGYEALVMAKAGVFHSKRQLSPGPDPAYFSTPYASFAAACALVQGVLAALFEREASGRGQAVDVDLLTSVGAHDTYNWFYEMILRRYPDAFKPQISAFDDQGRPQSRLMYALLVAATKDGTWLQFAHTAPRLMKAWLDELGLSADLDDEKWAGFPDLPDPDLRFEWWTRMLAEVGDRTLADWEAVFEANSNVFGEQFRTPAEALDHPQIAYEGRVAVVEDPELGAVRQPSTLIHAGGLPLTELRPAPRVGQHREQILAEAAEARPAPTAAAGQEPNGLPLAGVTVLELGGMFAAPYGATLLTDLGARVIKVEPLDGDLIRGVMAFPEAGGGKVLQGKESIALDLRSAEGRAIVHRLASEADLVLQCYRAGVAERLGVDEATLKQLNPDLVYLSSPGYGIDGPYGGKPAYAPSIAAASGISLTDAPRAPQAPQGQDELLTGARHLYAGGAVPAVQADGVAALGVGSALALGIYARARGVKMDRMVTTMLGSATQLLINHNTTYADRGSLPSVDAEFRGTGALYRMYPASDGWVFLAAAHQPEWERLVDALGGALADERFASVGSRREHAEALSSELSEIFATRTKQEWEETLTAQGIGCVAVAQENSEWVLQSDEFYDAGVAVDTVSPIFDEHRRLAPLCTFSRSATKADSNCTLGQHTDAILVELGYADRIADLRARDIVR